MPRPPDPPPQSPPQPPQPPLALPAILDIEASGFGAGSFPIEVGFVCADGRAWCSLVRPEADWSHWDPQAERLHGIAPAQLQAHGRPAREVALRLNQDLAGEVVYTDGWAHDYAWLARLFDAAGFAPRFRLESLHRLLDEARLARLDALRRQAFERLQIARHRASSDARALQWAVAQLEPACPVTPGQPGSAPPAPETTTGP